MVSGVEDRVFNSAQQPCHCATTRTIKGKIKSVYVRNHNKAEHKPTKHLLHIPKEFTPNA